MDNFFNENDFARKSYSYYNDYIVESWCGMDVDPDYNFEYLSYTSFSQACIFGERESWKQSLLNYGDFIKEDAERYSKERHVDYKKAVDKIFTKDYCQYAVYRVLPETPKDEIKNWNDDPFFFIDRWCVREV